MRRHLKASVALAAAIAAIGIVGPASAGAEVGHVFSSSFAVTGNPVSVAVDESNGTVYVLNTAGNVLKYSSTGAPVNFSGLTPPSNSLTTGCAANCRQVAVDDSGLVNQGVIYVSSLVNTNPGKGVRVYPPTGRASTFIENGFSDGIFGTSPFCGVGVDSAGVVYSSHTGTNTNPNLVQNEVTTYKPGQILPDPAPAQIWPLKGIIDNVGNPNPCRLAVDSKSHMYLTPDSSTVANQFLPREILRYTVDPFSNSTPTAKVVDTGSTGLAVDQSGDDLYSNHGASIFRYNVQGDLSETFGSGKLVDSGGVAVNGTNGTVYAANRLNSDVQVFTTVITPDVNSTSATTTSPTAADLTASVDDAGAGNITTCKFELGATTAYALPSVPCSQSLPVSGAQDVSASLSSLTEETTYHYRVVVANANGTSLGPDRTFTTHNVVGVSTDEPTDITRAGATLKGSFTGTGEPTSYYFEWGQTSGYGKVTPTEPAGEPSTGPRSVSAPITGLKVYLPESAPYHYRFVAVNGSGTTRGPDRTFFSAPPDAPEISDPSTTEVTSSSASLSASIEPGGGPTVFWVEYGPTPAYGTATSPGASIGEDEAEHPVSTTLAGLQPGATYHYRILAANFGGIRASADRSFDTPAPPTIAGLASSGIGQSTATLEAQVAAGFSSTTYHFEYGLTRSYGSATPETGLLGAGNSPESVSAQIAGLKPGIAYHYRVVAANALGIAESADQALSTEALPVVKQSRPPKPVSTKCKKGFVKKNGKCKKKPKPKKKTKQNRGEQR